jgi:hypothetical protein
MPYVCSGCGSKDVYTDIWQNLNDDTIIDGAGEEYCHNCESETDTIVIGEEE